MKNNHKDIDRILIRRPRISRRVGQLAREVIADMKSSGTDELVIVPILTGAFIFCADLIRRIPLAMRIQLMSIRSYPGPTVQSQGAKILADQLGDIRGRHVLLMDDILDSGGTLKLVIPLLKKRGARSVKVCVLLRKDRPSARSVHADYVGFDIPDEFVVGYGLDYNNYYRNLPDICTLKPRRMRSR